MSPGTIIVSDFLIAFDVTVLSRYNYLSIYAPAFLIEKRQLMFLVSYNVLIILCCEL